MGTYISISFGIGSVLGRPLAAKVFEFTGKRQGFVFLLFLMGLMAVLEPVMAGTNTGSLAAIFVNNLLYGFGFGAFISNLPPITAELVGMEKFPAAIGLVYASFGISMMLGPPLCGYQATAEATGTNSTGTEIDYARYDNSYYESGAVMFLGALMSIRVIYFDNLLAPKPEVTETIVMTDDGHETITESIKMGSDNTEIIADETVSV